MPKTIPFRRAALSVIVATALSGSAALAIAKNSKTPMNVHGVVAGTLFTPPSGSVASTTVPSHYAGARVCVDLNDNAACDAGEPAANTDELGRFHLQSEDAGPLVAEIFTGGSKTNVFRAPLEQLAEGATDEGNALAAKGIAVTPLTTEVARMMEADNLDYVTAKQDLARRLEIAPSDVVADPNGLADGAQKTAAMIESVILTNRFAFATKLANRGDAPCVKDAEQAAMNIEGIPRYDHIFIVMLENKATLSIKGSPFAPKINALLSANSQFTNYFATGNPSEPNYTALGGADDFGITDDSQWNCDATGPNAVQDLPLPTKDQPGLASSPFQAVCTQAAGVNHNLTGKPNLFNALTAAGMQWRTYNESMNPGQDIRTDSVADPAVVAPDHVYTPGTVGNNAGTIGNSALQLPMPAGLYKTKHHPGMAYQNVRSAPEFLSSNRTLGGGQWDAALANSSAYKIPSGYDFDQFSTDLQSGDVGQINFVIPDQCDDMHGVTVRGTVPGSTTAVTASDCSSVSNNVPITTSAPIITRGDNYVDYLVQKIEASPIWKNTQRRVAIVLMFDEGSATSGFNSCCGWNPANSTVAAPLNQNPDGTFSRDTSVNNYTRGNRGHGNSIFGVITNQPGAPKGISDNDAYSHFSFVRTLQDMFGLADPKDEGSYMNRSKYTEKFIAANILNLPEYAGSADTHFDAVRSMNHQFVPAVGYVQKSSADVNAPLQDTSGHINVWALK